MNKKIIYNIILYTIFTFLLVLTMFKVKDLTRDYILEIQNNAGDINKISKDLGKQNLTPEEIKEAEGKINYVTSVANKGLIMNYFILPFAIFILFLIFRLIYWKINVNTKINNIILLSLIEFILSGLLVYYLLRYLDYKLLAGEKSSLLIPLIFGILLFIINYFSYILFVKDRNYKNMIKFSFKYFKKLILYHSLIFITNLIYFIVIFVIFSLTYLEYSIILPSIVLFLIIIGLVIEKYYFIKKVNSLQL